MRSPRADRTCRVARVRSAAAARRAAATCRSRPAARWPRRRPRRGPDDDAHVDRVVRRRADPGEVLAGRRSGVAAAGVEQRPGRRGELRAARARRRCGDWQRRPTTSCTGCCGTFRPPCASLPEGVPQASQLPDGTRQISASGPYYRGPGAPAAGPAHHYVFELFALDATIDVPPVGASPPQTRAAVVAAMAGHVRGKGVLVGLFRRTP